MKNKIALVGVAFLTMVMAMATLASSGSVIQSNQTQSDQTIGSSITGWSSTSTLLSEAGIRYLDGDIAKGKNYYYAYSDEYRNPANAMVMRSADGVNWSSPVTVISGLNYPHGGFCVYSVGGTDNIIVSTMGQVRKSSDNGQTFSMLTSLPQGLDYTTVATNASMGSPGISDNDIYIAGNVVRCNNGVFLYKSTDGGVTWSQLYRVSPWIGYDTEDCTPVLVRTDSKLYCIFAEGAYWSKGVMRDVYVVSSDDWGKTWSGMTKIFTHTQFCAYPGHAQPLDNERCLLTIADAAYPIYSNGRGVYGYFWYSNCTFQMVGCETGTSFNNWDGHTYGGIISKDRTGVRYTSIWCYYINSKTTEIKTHFTYDSRLAFPAPATVKCTVDVDPDTVQAKSNGNWITVCIEMPSGYNPAAINVSTIMLNKVLSATGPSDIGDYDSDGISDLMVKFDRAQFVALTKISPGEKISFIVTITGQFGDGTFIAGTDTVQVMDNSTHTKK